MRKQYHDKWLAPAKKLGVGKRGRLDCPRCGWGTGTNAAIINHNHKEFSVYCNACKLVRKFPKGKLSLAELKAYREMSERAKESLRLELPHDYTLTIPEIGRRWLYKCGISPSIWPLLGIGWSEYYQRVVLPVYNREAKLIWYQLRAVHEGQLPKYIQPSAAKDCVYTISAAIPSRIAVVVEDIASATRINLTKMNVHAYAMMGTTLTKSQLNTLRQYDYVLVWTDADKAGRDSDRKVRRTLSLWTTTGSIVTEVDPKYLSNEKLAEHISRAILKL